MKPLITFFALAYGISWLIWLPLYGHIFGLTNLPVLPYHHAIGGFGPLSAAFITTWIYGKRAGLNQLWQQMFKVQPFIYVLIALLSPFVLAVLAAVGGTIVNGVTFDVSGLWRSKEFPAFNFFVFFAYNLLFFGFGEEVGWRGFALPRIQNRYSALSASILLTVFWALWHWPLFFYRPGYTSMDIAGILGWVFSLLTGSILLSWLYNASKGSILVCAIFHSTIDVAFTADFKDVNMVGYLGMLITLWGILTIFIFKPKNLARAERVKQEV